MKKRTFRLISAFLGAALMLTVLPTNARAAVTLTAVNDTILPLSDDTMPVRLGGEMYVPYEVFSTLGVASNYEDGELDLSANGQTLSFSTTEGSVYDQNDNSYPSPAYDRNGTVFVPVNLCCGKFGLMNSTLISSGQTILRLTDGSARSDSDFAADAAASVQREVSLYYSINEEPEQWSEPEPDPEQEPPPEPPAPEQIPQTETETETTLEESTEQSEEQSEPPPVEEEPALCPSRVSLAFFGAPTDSTSAILDSLRDTRRKATFFLPVDTASWRDDDIRRIAAEGHMPALLLDVGTAEDGETLEDPSALLARLTDANKKLFLICGLSARIVANVGGRAALTGAQERALSNAGYQLQDSTLDSGDDVSDAFYAYAETTQYFAETSAPVVLRLHHTEETAETVRLLSDYMSRQGIPCSSLRLMS